MSWSWRKSKSFGPVRMNMSTRGVGWSFGLFGVRIGIQPGGKKYVSAGWFGFRYMKVFK